MCNEQGKFLPVTGHKKGTGTCVHYWRQQWYIYIYIYIYIYVYIYIYMYIVWKWCYQVGLNYIAVILSAHFSSSSSPAICVLPSNHVFIKRVPSPSIKTQNNQHKKEIQTNKSASVMEGASWLSWCPQELSNKLSTHNSL